MKIVYVYNYRDILTITRDSSGDWAWHYVPSKVFRYLNKRIGAKKIINPTNCFHYGSHLGIIISKALIYCMKSYGDPIPSWLHHKH